MRQNTHRLSERIIKNKLEPNISLEYTRDSPLFRQQLTAFDDSFQGISTFAEGVKGALREYNDALNAFSRAQRVLSYALVGKNHEGKNIEGSNSSRCFFTKALPELGDLAKTLNKVSSSLVGAAAS